MAEYKMAPEYGFMPTVATCSACIDCKHRKMQESNINGKEIGYRKASCSKYKVKPHGVAFESEDCILYEKQ